MNAKSWIIVHAELLAKEILKYAHRGSFIIEKKLYKDVDEQELVLAMNNLPGVTQATVCEGGISACCK